VGTAATRLIHPRRRPHGYAERDASAADAEIIAGVTMLLPAATDQAGLVTRAQALGSLSPQQLRTLLAGRWQRVLPGVYATFTGQLTFEQRCRAALLYCGEGALLSDASALTLLRAKYLPRDDRVHVLVHQSRGVHSRDWVVVRRTHYFPPVLWIAGSPCVPAERALAEFSHRVRDERAALAVVSWALTQRVVSIADLEAAFAHLPRLGRACASNVLRQVRAGVRSVGEAAFVQLSRTSRVLPEPKLNWLLQLPSGRKVSPDALYLESAIVHETNGRDPHGDEDRFESMQERADAMTAAGLAVFGNTPRQISAEGRRILGELEQAHVVRDGLGLPPGVVVLRASA
jgi:hypothetical protein